MIKIEKIEVLNDKHIFFHFSDDTEKIIDFTSFIGEDELTKPLADQDYFKKVNLYEDGRGIYWPNEYDFCPDFLRQYQPANEDSVINEEQYSR